jgi:hypothetical protein
LKYLVKPAEHNQRTTGAPFPATRFSYSFELLPWFILIFRFVHMVMSSRAGIISTGSTNTMTFWSFSRTNHDITLDDFGIRYKLTLLDVPSKTIL